ncbi:MAG: cysteine desulfurase / selenocysteine lyase [Solirubrobacteraceae bacterium]|jgi:cysteine desulfurase/selenocysteine lyase|nr:cysteine desulfurase / selenocysteine lyase [Solirubrobacteraceae bacterium]
MSTLADTPLATDFPCLQREGIVYMDSAATSQTPQPVIDAMADYYEHHRGTVHRSVYALAAEATELFEGARDRIAAFMNWPAETTIFTKNATEALNLVAYSWGRANLGAGDGVVVTQLEHHSNFVPWHMLCRETGAQFQMVEVDDECMLDMAQLEELLAAGNVKLVAVGHVSNAAGTINPVAEIVERAHAAGAVVVVDGSQAVPQMPVDLAEIGADFYAWTGHKLYGPTGIGILHGRKELLDAMPPFLGGGHMIASVSVDEIRWGQLPAKFEAGTSNIAEAIGLGAAVDFVSALGMESIREHERDLCAYALERLSELPDVTVMGPLDAGRRGALVAFTLDIAHPHDIAEILGSSGVCVRAGHHCAQPLMQRFGVAATTRASFAVHNTRADVDALVDGLDDVRKIFG